MTYSTLVAAKGNPGSIANWVSYGKIDIPTVLEEAQSILYQSLRVREMRTEYVFGLSVGQSRVALPARFLDPISRIYDHRGMRYVHRQESDITSRRSFEAVSGGALGNNPFTTGPVNSSQVSVQIVGHGLTQGSDITLPASAPTVDGISLAGTFPVTGVTDADHVIITSSIDQATAGNVTGGGSGVTWSANRLISTAPSIWSIFDEAIQFEAAFNEAVQCRMLYFRAPPLLSATNPTNFITSRYPRLLREATNAAAASFMKDDNEEQKALTKLGALIQDVGEKDDLIYRGSDITTETPGSSGEAY